MDDQGAVNSKMYEVLWYNRALRDTEVWQVENYLAEKWGLRGSMTSNSPMRFYRSLSPVFNPSLIPGCSLWLDAADRAEITITAGKVTLWGDKSGLGFNVSGTNNGTLDKFNGLDVIQMNGSSSYENSSFSLNGPLSIVVISKLNSIVANAWQTIMDNRTALRHYVGLDAGNNKRVGAVRWGGNATLNPEIWALTYSATDNTRFNVNGTSTIEGSTGYGGVGFINGGIRIGFAGNNSAYWGGWMGEIVIFNSELSLTQVQLVEGYLAWKWGMVGNLPSTHPYKKTPV
jgi:hypothetical protein